MKKNALVLTLLGMVLGLSACTSSSFDFLKGNQEKNTIRPNPDETADSSLAPPPEVESVGTIGGSMSNAMNSADRAKLAHALDNPLGKSSTWTNRNSGITYTVTPTNKTTVNENPYCREYNIRAYRGGNSRSSSGVACVSSDGNWKSVSN